MQPKDRRPPEVSFSRCPLVFVLQKNKKNKKNKRKEMNKGPATLQQCAKRSDLAGWYTGENSGGVPPRPLNVELAVGGCTRARGPCAECRVRRACC